MKCECIILNGVKSTKKKNETNFFPSERRNEEPHRNVLDEKICERRFLMFENRQKIGFLFPKSSLRDFRCRCCCSGRLLLLSLLNVENLVFYLIIKVCWTFDVYHRSYFFCKFSKCSANDENSHNILTFNFLTSNQQPNRQKTKNRILFYVSRFSAEQKKFLIVHFQA